LSREDIIEEVKHFTTFEELRKHDWNIKTKIMEQEQVKSGEQRRNKNGIWIFRHLYEEGLRAEFKKNNDGTLKFIKCIDEKK